MNPDVPLYPARPLSEGATTRVSAFDLPGGLRWNRENRQVLVVVGPKVCLVSLEVSAS